MEIFEVIEGKENMERGCSKTYDVISPQPDCDADHYAVNVHYKKVSRVNPTSRPADVHLSVPHSALPSLSFLSSLPFLSLRGGLN